MLRTLETHPDELAWLRHVVGDTDDLERRRLDRHLRSCTTCVEKRSGVERLDGALRRHRDVVFGPQVPRVLAAADPFAIRPRPVRRLPSSVGLSGADVARAARGAASSAASLKAQILESSTSHDHLVSVLEALRLELLETRFALGYALDEAPRRMVEGAARWGRFGEATQTRLARERYAPFATAPAHLIGPVEFAYPLAELGARAALVRGIAAGWTGEFAAGGLDLAESYRLFGEGKALETSLATVELHEAQRRCFVGDARSGLPLARRAVATFAAWRLPDDYARARYAEGLCLSYLDRDEEAVPVFRETAAALAREGLWKPYIMAVNAVGSCLVKLGDLDGARREYARALRVTSAIEHPSAHAFLRFNLADVLLHAGRLTEALAAFRKSEELFARQEMQVDALTARLYRVEILARLGRRREAVRLVSEMRDVLGAKRDLDTALASISGELASDKLDLERILALREELEAVIRRELRA